MPSIGRKLRVFLCHASPDKDFVRELYKQLLSEDWIEPWLDEEKLLPGQDWNMEIERAVEASDVVIVILSKNSVTKEGYVQRELRLALDVSLEKPEGTIYIIPIRLNKCQIPRRLREWQYLDYSDNRAKAYSLLLSSLETRKSTMDIVGEIFYHPPADISTSRDVNDNKKNGQMLNMVQSGDDEMLIQSGNYSAGREKAMWQLLEGRGERFFQARVEFAKPFKEPPIVTMSLSGLDVDKADNLRVRVEARDVDRNGFTVFLMTWWETQVYRLWVQWVAYGN